MSMSSTQDQILVNSEVAKKGKNKLIAYLLLICVTGLFGVHRFYIGKVGSGILMLLLSWTGISLVWCVIDLFWLSGAVDRHNKKIEDEATQQILLKRAYAND